jgi:integration host factor subunit beta
LAVVKSKIIDNLSDNYPNFLKKDLSKLVEIILSQIEDALIRKERIELRDIFTLETKVQKARISRNPKTNEKVSVPEKKTVQFKMSKKWFNKLNNE